MLADVTLAATIIIVSLAVLGILRAIGASVEASEKRATLVREVQELRAEQERQIAELAADTINVDILDEAPARQAA